MNILNDIYTFISYWSFVDVVFFVAIITLLILIVTLIYFININKECLDESDFFPPSSDLGKKSEENDETDGNIKQTPSEEEKDSEEEIDDEEGELLDLESLTKKLESEKDCDAKREEYEKEQEEKAIISYTELLEKRNRFAINYEKEEILDDLVVKKVDLNDLENKEQAESINEEIKVISYQKEEAFLKALQELNGLLH